jgi:hypothetical protein
MLLEGRNKQSRYILNAAVLIIQIFKNTINWIASHKKGKNKGLTMVDRGYLNTI